MQCTITGKFWGLSRQHLVSLLFFPSSWVLTPTHPLLKIATMMETIQTAYSLSPLISIQAFNYNFRILLHRAVNTTVEGIISCNLVIPLNQVPASSPAKMAALYETITLTLHWIIAADKFFQCLLSALVTGRGSRGSNDDAP